MNCDYGRLREAQSNGEEHRGGRRHSRRLGLRVSQQAVDEQQAVPVFRVNDGDPLQKKFQRRAQSQANV